MINKSFDSILISHFSTLHMIDDDKLWLMNNTDVACYRRDILCSGSCLDWRQICNGIVDCEDGQDEISCDLLELNRCHDDDEYRCRSGHCIPMIFAFDKSFDCADGSDEQNIFSINFQFNDCYIKVPNMFCDDYNNAWMKFPCGDGDSIETPFYVCANQRQSLVIKQLYANDNTSCWQYMICVHYRDYLFPLLVNCNTLCDTNDHCSNLLPLVCDEETVIFPSKPIMLFPSVYFVYQINKTHTDDIPDLICYTQCDHIHPPTSEYHGYSCLLGKEFFEPLSLVGFGLSDVNTKILYFFSGCVRNIKTNGSMLFHCPIENRTLTYYRIKDEFMDCYLGFDEQFDNNTCVENSTQQFRCWSNSNECTNGRLVVNSKSDCSDSSDEFYGAPCLYGTETACDYQRGFYQSSSLIYSYQEICDGLTQTPSLFWIFNGTDETDCEDFWCLSSPSIRCNGYWECIDGRDELNCSLDSLRGLAKSSKLLHTLNGCHATEHFCLHISNRSNDLSRSCISSSYIGDGHIDCFGASDERYHNCAYRISKQSNTDAYQCAGTKHECIDIRSVCNKVADCSLQDDEKLCDWLPENVYIDEFYCRNGTVFTRTYIQCNGKLDCADGEDEWFCDLKIDAPKLTQYHNNIYSVYPPYLSNITMISHVIYSLQTPIYLSSRINLDWHCNRGIYIVDSGLRRCLCPPYYLGECCEYQRERISVILQIILSALIPQNNAIKFVLYLIDLNTSNILTEDEILHLPYIHSSYKHLITLASIRANNSFVRIDAYKVNIEKIIAYHTSWKFILHFPFLPVRRLTARLVFNIDETISSRLRSNCHDACIHGQCLSYQNSDDIFCHCYNGWTGGTCNESLVCAPGAISLSSNRCLCPMNRYGIRCFARKIVECQCQNDGICISLDARIKESACLCSGNYFGLNCERQHANLTIKMFDKHLPEKLPIVLVQLVNQNNFEGMDFQNTFLFEHVSIHQTLVIYHIGYEELPLTIFCKIYFSSSIDDYKYYIVLRIPYLFYLKSGIRLRHVETQLDTKQECFHVRQIEIFKRPINILAYPYIKRIKYYLRGCSDKKVICFHDEKYLCLCPLHDNQTVRCIIYDHTREKCQRSSSYCLNEGLCIENQRAGLVEFACLCSSCHYYGALCQFSLGQYGLSLDALVGVEMQTGKTLSEQSILIKSCIGILTCMVILGFIGNILCIITFLRKKSRITGCGYYLLLATICNQFALILFALRFIYFLITQMILWDDRNESLILCQCLEYGLILLPNLSNWLSACVSIERAFTVARGALFDKQTSVRIAKRLSIILTIVLAVMTVPEPLSRHLIEDPRLGRYTWCVAQYNSIHWRTLASFLSIMHLLGPFLINLFSTVMLIVFISRQKTNIRKDKTSRAFGDVLREQAAHYKYLLISPTVLLIMTLPRLVISLGSLCIDTSWRNYIFLAGYFISFIPFMTTLFIFVLPSPVYYDELKRQMLQIRHFFNFK